MDYKVSEDKVGKRLDAFLSELENLDISRSFAKNLIENEDATVNKQASKASYKLKFGDVVCLDLPEPEELNIPAEDIPLDIVFEDDDLMVINKPVNMITHPAPGVNTGTLVNAILYHIKKTGGKLSDINGVLRPGIVHRLDKDTSGLILVAKSNLAHKSLSDQIQDRTCKRTYWALVHENIKENSGTINKPIGRHPQQRNKMFAFSSLDESSNARHATTHYKVLDRYNHKDKNYCLVECSLDTGRTHQIRVHMSHIKRPIMGDYTYSAPDKHGFKIERPMLHSKKISFLHPISKKNIFFETDLPNDFNRIHSLLRAD